jgi:hypothetical protein
VCAKPERIPIDDPQNVSPIAITSRTARPVNGSRPRAWNAAIGESEPSGLLDDGVLSTAGTVPPWPGVAFAGAFA